MDFKNFVNNCILRHKLPDNKHAMLVALSGGADSVALACVLQDLGYRIEAAHCNFCLRGKESDRDEEFVIEFCKQRHIPLHIEKFATHAYALKHRISIEMAARNLRYDFFYRLLKQNQLDFIAVAHHREDNNETVLLNLLRGTGIRGLRGIPYQNERVVRPMLDASRKQIETYLDKQKQAFVTDSTNLEDEVQRNKIRLHVMPQLRAINPAADERMHEATLRMEEAYQIYQYGVQLLCKNVMQGNRILLEELKQTPAPATVLYEILSKMNFNPAQIADIYEQSNGDSGKVYESSTHRLLRDRNVLVFEEQGNILPENFEKVLPLEGLLQATEDVCLQITRRSYQKGQAVPRDKHIVWLDLDKLEFPLVIRTTKKADRFMPFGMKGMKLVSDFLTDIKKNVFEKEKQLLLCSGDKIAWVIGERPDERFRITEQTQHVLCITWIQKNTNA